MSYNTFSLLSRFSEQSAITLDYGVTGIMFGMEHDTVYVPTGGARRQTVQYSILSIPIGVDFRTGGEVSLNKNDKGLFAVGMGIAPSVMSGDVSTKFNIRAVPFFKLEAGFFLGIAFKVKWMTYLGEAKYVNESSLESYNVFSSMRYHGKFGSLLTVGVMPFSWDWNRERW